MAGKQYCIFRTEKVKKQGMYTLKQEHNRSEKDRYTKTGKERFVDSDINWEKTCLNEYYVKKDGRELKSNNWNETIERALKTYGIKSHRKDAIVCTDAFVSATPEWFADKTKEQIMSYFEDALIWYGRNYGPVFNAVTHWDETTPHIHFNSIPLVKNPDGTYKLCAKDIYGNRAKMSEMQTKFAQEVGSKHGLERGESRTPEYQREHKTNLEHKVEELTMEIQRMEGFSTALDDDIRLKQEKVEDVQKKLEDVQSEYLSIQQVQQIKPKKLFGSKKHYIEEAEFEDLVKRATACDKITDISDREEALLRKEAEFDADFEKMQEWHKNLDNWEASLQKKEYDIDKLACEKYSEYFNQNLDDGTHKKLTYFIYQATHSSSSEIRSDAIEILQKPPFRDIYAEMVQNRDIELNPDSPGGSAKEYRAMKQRHHSRGIDIGGGM